MEYATPVSLLSLSTNEALRFIESPSFQKGQGVIVIEDLAQICVAGLCGAS
jgi:hypothetical protein